MPSQWPVGLEQVVKELESKGVKIHTFTRYYFGPQSRNGLIFGYGAVDIERMTVGLRALRAQLKKTSAPRAALGHEALPKSLILG